MALLSTGPTEPLPSSSDAPILRIGITPSSTSTIRGRSVIVKVVNPTEQAYTLTLNGTWQATAPATYDFFAPGDLMIGNTMDHKDAVALQHATVDPTGPSYNLSVAPYSAGVLTINLRTSLQ